MTALNGSVGGGDDPRQPYGVLGTGTQLVFNSEEGPQPVASVGVEGIVADSDDAIANYEDEHFGNALSQPVAAGVLGVQLAPVVPGETVQIDSYGFLGGRSPFAGELTGVFGQAAQRGVVGIAGAPDGIGVYGGSVGGRRGRRRRRGGRQPRGSRPVDIRDRHRGAGGEHGRRAGRTV